MRRGERKGSVVVLVAVLMVVLLGFGAFAVDVAQMQAYKSELRRTADAAALAAAKELLTDPGNARAMAVSYVGQNTVMGGTPAILDTTYGVFDPIAGTFSPATPVAANAFRVTVQSDGEFYLAQLLGGSDFSATATATAWLPISTTQCVKPWAIEESRMISQLGSGWAALPFLSLRLLDDTLSAKVFVIKNDITASFSGIVNLPAYFDVTLGGYYPGGYSATTYAQSISGGCQALNIGDTLQTKIGGYNPESASGILGSLPGLSPVCSFLAGIWCHNIGGQLGVAVRVPIIRLVAPDPTIGCTTNPIDLNDNYGTVAAPQVLCAVVTDLVSFVLTRVVVNAGETIVFGSYAGDDVVGPVNGYAQRPVLVQ